MTNVFLDEEQPAQGDEPRNVFLDEQTADQPQVPPAAGRQNMFLDEASRPAVPPAEDKAERERFIEDRHNRESVMKEQLQYVIDNSKDDKERQQAERWQRFLGANNILDKDDDWVKRSEARVGSLHKKVADRRGHLAKFRDALVRGYDSTAIMAAQTWLGITDGDNPETQKTMRNLQSVGREWDASRPKATGSVSDIKSAGDVLDFIGEAIGENLYRGAIGTTAAIASGGTATMLGAGAVGASAAAIGGSSLSTLALNTGEAVQDQLDEGVPFSRGWALAQGAGYSVLDGALGVEAGIGKLAVKTGLRAAKDTAVAGLKEVGKMATKKGALKTLAKSVAGEALQEPAQSQVVGRLRRLGQTGSMLRKGETVGEAWMEALDEAAGGAAAALGMGGGGAAISHANARRIVGIHNRVVNAVKQDAAFNELPPEQQLLVARRFMNDCLLETSGILSEEQKADLRTISEDIDAELGRKDADTATKAANAVLRGFDLVYAKDDFNEAVKEAKESGEFAGRVDWNAMRDSAQDIGEVPGGYRGTRYTDPVTGQSIVRRSDKDGHIVDFIVENRRGLKDSLTGDALHTKSLKKALEACADLDIYNQYRAKKSEAKRQVIKEMFSRMYGERGANLVIADSVASMQDPEMRDKIARAGANAAYDAKNNTVYVLADRMRNLGQLYIDLAHERSHLDIAEHILGRSLEGGATDEEMERLEAGRKERFAETGRGDAEAGEEAVAEHASVEQVLKAIRDSSLSLPGAVADYVRQRISKDTGIAASLVSDEDVRSELKFLADGGYLGKSAETRGSVEEDTEADAAAETQAKSATDAAAMTKAEKQRKQAEREAVAAKARGKAERKAAGEEAARVIAQDGGEESVPPIGAAKEKRTDRGAAMESALGAAGEEIGRGREKAAEAREAEDAEKKRLVQEEAARKERVKDRKGDVEAALDEAGAEIGDMAEKRRVVRERAEGVAEQNRREAEERNEAERDAEEAAALAEEERWRPAREAAAQREQDAYDQMILEFEESRSTKSAKNEGETTNETGNGANEAPAQSAETSAEPENAAKTPRSAENEPQGGETGGVVKPKAAQNRAEAPVGAPGARSTAETGNDTPAAQNAPEGVSRGAVAMSADDFVAAHSDVDEKGKRRAHRDILTQGEVAPPADAAPKKAKKVKAGDTAGVFRAVGRHASQDNTRKSLMSVHVEDGQLVATDDRRIIVVPAPEGVENGTYSAKNPTEKADLKYPRWQQVVPSLKKNKYAKVGEISNGDATHGRAAFADELRRKVERSRKGDAIGALLRIGDRYLNPQYVKEIVDTMFSLGADKVQVYMSPNYAPVVFKGRSERGEMTGVVMPLRLMGYGDAPSEKGTHVRLFSDAGGTRFKRSVNADASRVEAAEGVVSLGDMRKLFDRLNNDEQTAQLAEAVFAAAKNAGVDVAVESLLPEQGSDPEDNGGRPFGTSFRGYVKYDLGYLNGDQYDDRHKAETIVHELIHSLTSYAISAVNGDAEKELPRGLKVNDELKAAVKDLATIFDESRFYLATDQKTSYASTDIHEFIAEFSNKDVRDVLKKRKFWERVVDCIRRIIDGFIRLNSYPADTDRLVNGLDAMSGVLGRFLDNFDRKAFEATKAFDATRKRDRFWQEPQKRGFARIIDGEAANGGSTRFKRGADGLSPEGQRQYDEVVRRYTNPDGTKKRGWMKAPNGKPTKLTERQWVQVRTPAFKEWFGDWEANAVRATWYDIADVEDVLSLAAQDVRGIAPLADKAAIKSAFAKWGEVQNVADKRKVVFPNASAGRFGRVGAVSGALNTLFEQSRRAWSEPDDGRHPNIAAIHHYVAKAQTADGEVYVHFTVREDNRDGNGVHAATVSSVEAYRKAETRPGPNLEESAISESASPNRGFADNKIAYFLGGVNPASKVVDENGEPLVMYRGAEFDPLAQEPGKGVIKPEAYFTADSEYANRYTGNGGKVRSYYLNIRHPFDIRDPECLKDLQKIYPDHNFTRGESGALDWAEASVVEGEFLKENFGDKYDGVIYDEGGDPTNNGPTHRGISYVPLDGGAQAKSATDNIGDFSGSDDIRFKRGEEEYDPRGSVPNVRGGWTEQKILRYLKAHPSLHGVTMAVRLISEFDTVEELKDHMFYHGTKNFVGSMQPSMTKSERWAQEHGGGGYGQRYWGISISKSKKIASNFGNPSPGVSIYPVVLAKGAKVIDRPDLIDAADVEDHIVELWNDGVDAVRLGDWNSDTSEQELLVLNPRAICNIGNADYYRYFQLGSDENPLNIKDDAQIAQMLEAAKEYADYRPSKRFGKPLPPSMFEDGTGELKSKEVRDAERERYEKDLAEWRESERGVAAAEYERKMRDDIRFKRSAPVDSPDALFGARASRKAHGLSDLTAEESNLAYTDKELYAAGQRVSKDVPHMMGVVSDALTSDRALSLEDTFALTVFLRDRLDALADVHAKMQSGNAASFAAEEEYLSAIVDKASRAVARNNTKLAGLRVARLGVALDTARDTEAWITEEVKSRRVAQGLPAEPSEADAAMIKQHAERLAKLNAENEALRKEIEELRRKAAERTGEAAIEQSRRRARKDAPRALPAERRAKAEKEFGTTLTDDDSAGFAELDGIFGKGAVFKGGSQSAALTPEMTAAFAKLAKGGFDRAEKMVLKQYPQAASAWQEFRLRSEGVGAEELAKLAEPIAPRRRATTRNLAEARGETKRLLDENADDPREQRKAIGRYLRRYRDALINENPDIPTAELNERMAAEATALTGTKHDAVAMLAVSAGVDGYDLETRTDIQRRIAKARHALSLFRQGKVNEAAREAGILYDDEATALKDMEDALRKLVKEKADEIDYLSTFSESNAEAVERVKQLKAELDEANDALRLMRKETSLAEKKRKYAEVLEKRLAEAQRRANALRGEIESKAFRERKSAAEAKVAELKAALSAARRSEDALKRIQDRIAEYERRIADEDYDAQVLRYQANDAYLQSKLALARERRNEARRKLEAERRKRSYREKGVVGKALYGLGGLLGEMKGVVASFDLSSVLRQGGQLSWAHPFLAAKNLGETLKAWKSAEYANNLMAQLRMRPNWQYYEKAGIDFTDWGEGATNKEDVFLLNQFRRITSQKFVKAGVEASERAFSMFLNLMRADVFDAMASGSTFGSAANMNDSQLKALGKFINIATQRATFEKGGKWEKAIPALNTILWSPRNVASRFQFLYETARLVTGGAAYGDVTMRSLFAKELVRYIGGMGAAAMFLKAVNELLFREPDDPPDETEFDPRSSDFLKVRFGNVRIDLTSGLTPILVFGTRMVSGETKNVRGQVRKSNRYELVGRFLRQKFAPGASLVYDLGIAREDFEKRDIDWGSAWDKEADRISAYRYLAGSFVPLSGVDLVEQAEVGGVPKTLVTGGLSILGANVQAFDPYNFKQLKGDYTYFKGLYDKAMDDEERRNLVRLCPMLKRRLGIEVALMRVRELDKMRKDAEKRGQPPPEWLEERIREAKQKAVGVMSGID